MYKILDRFSEPASYSGLSGVLIGLGIQVNPGLMQTGIYLAAGLCGLAAFFMKG